MAHKARMVNMKFYYTLKLHLCFYLKANAGAQQKTKAAEDFERMSSASEEPKSPNTENPKTTNQNKRYVFKTKLFQNTI